MYQSQAYRLKSNENNTTLKMGTASITRLLLKGIVKALANTRALLSPKRNTETERIKSEKQETGKKIKSDTGMKKDTPTTMNKKTKSPSDMKEMEQKLEKSGLKGLLNKEQKETLFGKGKVVIDGGKKIVHKVTTPAGYTYRAYENVNSITRQGIAEL